MEIYSVNLRIQSKYRKIRNRKNSLFGHFSRTALYHTIKDDQADVVEVGKDFKGFQKKNYCEWNKQNLKHCVRVCYKIGYYWSEISTL